jgi:hypothetical protein
LGRCDFHPLTSKERFDVVGKIWNNRKESIALSLEFQFLGKHWEVNFEPMTSKEVNFVIKCHPRSII